MSGTNKEQVVAIMKMTMAELLDYVINSPDLLTDSYYREFGNAIRKRAEELLR